MEQQEFFDLLKQGVDSWNFWRERNLDVEVDLIKISFHGDWSGIDFSGVNLSNSNFSEVDFSGANLSGANLSESSLKGANLSGTDFSKANLRKADLGDKGYEYTGSWLERRYFNTNLTNSNLTGADLHGANLHEANLSGAEFYGANLIRANLSEIQAADAQFAFAKFTGACIEDWQYNEATNFNGIVCDFVYLDSSRRKPYPVGRRFAPGEFTKEFQKSFETIDIVIDDTINFETFVYSFQSLQARHEDAQLDIHSIEERGDNIYVVKVGISPDVDQEIVHDEFMQTYEKIREALEKKYKIEIRVKDTQIVNYQQENQSLRENINNLHNILKQQTEVQKIMAETPKYDLRGSKFGGGFAGDGGTQIGGSLNDYSSKQSLDEAAAEIQQLLKQLE
ncbi:pentapeptide repeat-containing protein [Coleofasciculus chthonoplastes]|uniref:pentapeptide repeat-containing protein n=1 Tax=Coleofasciculus chthonoplastes TaxID=64178 RepID=UPI0033004A80